MDPQTLAALQRLLQRYGASAPPAPPVIDPATGQPVTPPGVVGAPVMPPPQAPPVVPPGPIQLPPQFDFTLLRPNAGPPGQPQVPAPAPSTALSGPAGGPGGSPPAHCTTGTVRFRIAPSR